MPFVLRQALLDFDADEDLPRMYALLALHEKSAAMVARSFKAACRVFGNHVALCVHRAQSAHARAAPRSTDGAAYRTRRVRSYMQVEMNVFPFLPECKQATALALLDESDAARCVFAHALKSDGLHQT
ncbi:hypothetical protein DFH09DRAFT_1100906 [Mycena vulgaris]|nr:hypothetical protein DFH09DRAFT_1100906 [Mycena vulgaris]